MLLPVFELSNAQCYWEMQSEIEKPEAGNARIGACLMLNTYK